MQFTKAFFKTIKHIPVYVKYYDIIEILKNLILLLDRS